MTQAIAHSTLYGRLSRGWPREKALSTPPRPNRYITANGKRQTLAAWARALGVPAATIYSRLTRGWTEEQAVTCPHDKRNAPRLLTVRGHTKRLKEWERLRGIPKAAILRRLYNGWSPSAAISTPINMQYRNGRSAQ